MKKVIPTLALVIGLQGVAVPAQAGNGMTDIISTMMQMFLMMMGGGSGMSGFSPYAMNSFNPMSNNGMNPYSNGAFPGYYGSTGSPYSTYGYGSGSPYKFNNDYYRANQMNGYHYNRYGQIDPGIYSGGRAGAYSDGYRPDYTQLQKQASTPVIIQPIIVSPANKEDGTATASVKVLPPQTVTKNATSVSAVAAVPVPSIDLSQGSLSSQKPVDGLHLNLEGRWQGINGELLQLGATSFRLQSKNSDLQGRYELKNGIMKITVANRKKPVYMQYRVENQHLAFRAENGEKMLFQRSN